MAWIQPITHRKEDIMGYIPPPPPRSILWVTAEEYREHIQTDPSFLPIAAYSPFHEVLKGEMGSLRGERVMIVLGHVSPAFPRPRPETPWAGDSLVEKPFNKESQVDATR